MISVAAGTVDHLRGGFSSNGPRYDNSRATVIGAGGHTVFKRDRIGIVHPDVTAPGVDISSSWRHHRHRDRPLRPRRQRHRVGHVDGLSHVAGAAAVPEAGAARPDPGPGAARTQATATRVQGTDDGDPETEQVFKPGTRLDLWQVGYGFVDLDAAVALVRGARAGGSTSPRPSRAPTAGSATRTASTRCAATSSTTTRLVRPSAARTATKVPVGEAGRTASPSPWRTLPRHGRRQPDQLHGHG